MRRYLRVLAWVVFIAAAFALPASSVRVHRDWSFRCQRGCLAPVLSKWPSHQIKKNGVAPQSAIAKDQSASIKSRALTVSDAELSR
jgi:hypothetical protein